MLLLLIASYHCCNVNCKFFRENKEIKLLKSSHLLLQWYNETSLGVLPYTSYIGVLPQTLWFLSHGLKMGMNFGHFGLKLFFTCLSQIGYTVQPINNARARSGARSSCAARTPKRWKEVKLHFIRKKFQTHEDQNPIRKKLQESYRKLQITARSL